MLNHDGRCVQRPATRFFVVLLLMAMPLFHSCSSRKEDLPPAPRCAVVVGAKALTVEAALDDAHRERGLMYRKQLGADEGMLFVYPSERTLCFWMKNTYVPLSVAFIRADGWIIQIEDMEPLDLVTHSSKMRGKYALEMPKGWFARNGVKEGDVVKVPEDVAQGAEGE